MCTVKFTLVTYTYCNKFCLDNDGVTGGKNKLSVSNELENLNEKGKRNVRFLTP